MKEFINYLVNSFPIKRDNRKDYKQIVVDLYQEYKKILNQAQTSNTVPDNIKNYIWVAEHFMNEIEDTIDLVYKGLRSEAYSKFKNVMDWKEHGGGIFCTLKRNDSTTILPEFYRIRKFENKFGKTYEDMFHIPFNLRHIIKAQRFSVPGQPCLYLGTSINSCWEELGRPRMDSWMVSKVCLQWPIRFIDLSIPSRTELENKFSMELWRCMLSHPLKIACMIPTVNNEDNYKPEYIISQFLTEYILEKNLEITKGNIRYEEITAIMYTSTRLNNEFKYGIDKFKNLAVPASFPYGKKYSELLCSLFHISDPICEEYERLRDALSYERGNGKTDSYSLSTFGKLEEALRLKSTNEVIDPAWVNDI